MTRRLVILIVMAASVAGLLTPVTQAQMTINLNSVIGVSGTNGADVDGVGNPVNLTAVASDSGPTTLTASGSTAPTAFNFNTGFSDTLDRATGSIASAGSVIADRKHDSGVFFILDTNNDGVFAESTLPGFGLHSDTFITFDLDVIRVNAGLAAGTAFTLSGLAGQANFTPYNQTSAAIILDSSQLAVFDWTESGPINQFSTYSLSISGSARYLTFIALSGLDSSNFGAHVGFANVQLTTVPEPSTYAALAGLACFAVAVMRRRTARGFAALRRRA